MPLEERREGLQKWYSLSSTDALSKDRGISQAAAVKRERNVEMLFGNLTISKAIYDLIW